MVSTCAHTRPAYRVRVLLLLLLLLGCTALSRRCTLLTLIVPLRTFTDPVVDRGCDRVN